MIYIFGHRKPDTDSICASVALAYLKKQQGIRCEAMALSTLNEETLFVLDYFKVPEPPYLNDVKLQIKDVHYNKGFFLEEKQTIYDAYEKMNALNMSGIPIVRNQKLIAMTSLKDLTRAIIERANDEILTSYDHIVRILHGDPLLKADEEINGYLFVAPYKKTGAIDQFLFTGEEILIVDERKEIIDYAIDSEVKTIILTGKVILSADQLRKAKDHDVNLIHTSLSIVKIMQKMYLCNYISTLLTDQKPIFFDETAYVNDFLDTVHQLKHTNYPIIDKSNICLGMIRVAEVSDHTKKQVILVDHNEAEQSAEGIEEAEILEIIDHHKIGKINTKYPINFRNMAVGSTCTILYTLYKEYRISPPNHIAGLLVAGILSDTLFFKSPTTTKLDEEATHYLANLINLDINKFAMKMFKATSNFKHIKGKSELLYRDFKTFLVGDQKVGVSQIFTLDVSDIKEEEREYVALLEQESVINRYDVLVLVVTDLVSNGSYFYYNESAKTTLERSFHINQIYQGYYLPDYFSRKKQIIPNIMDALEKK